MVVELAAVAGELTDDWGKVERSLVNVNRIDRPLMGLRIIEPESLAFIAIMQLNAIDVEFFEIRVAIEQLLVVRNPHLINPVFRVIRVVETVIKQP